MHLTFNINDGLMKCFRFFFSLLAILASAIISSCDRNVPDPIIPDEKPEVEKPDEEKPDKNTENTYSFTEDGEYAFKSVATMMIGENIAIAATPDEGFTDVTSIMERSSEYIYAAINPMHVALGNTIDLLTETSAFTISSTLKKAYLETIAPGETSEISGGTCTMTHEDGVTTFKAEIILSDNTRLRVHIVAAESPESPIVINKNIISRGDEIKPLRAAFAAETDGLVYMFLTPANIDYFSELDIVTWYLYLVVPTEMMTGNTIDTAELTEDDTFLFGMVDNLTAENSFEVDNSMLSGIKGSFSLEKTESGYKTQWLFNVGDNQYQAVFDGECKSTEEEAPVEENENTFSCGDEKGLTLGSAILEKGEDIWKLVLTVSNGKPLTITMSRNFFETGGTFGFSQDKNMKVEYDGVTYSKANGYSGTLTMHVDEAAGTVETSFSNYAGMEFYYKGRYSI